MEPMTLGSPVGSPVQTPGSPGSNSAYLPNFLLGETTHTPGRMATANIADTSRFSTMNSPTGLPSPIPAYGTPDYRHNRQKAMFANATSSGTSRISAESHAGGPPTKGLFDTFETAPPMESFSGGNKSLSRSLPRNLVNSNDPFLLDSPNIGTGEAQGLLRWITVFGFPPNGVNIVLSHISNRVRIVDKHPPPQTQSNWIHLKCATEQEAQRALTCNGNIVSGCIMIGVTPCTDEGVVMHSDKENWTANGSMRIFSSPTKIGTSESGNILSSPKSSITKRVLFNSQYSPSNIRQPDNVPQRSTGIVSRAMEYVFGW
ncbi:nucleoporin NUP53 [Fopius arisanus]|uniref:Nucleoporin NUP53 n=1 Tax=Fopius arisanus TaxID=64838 RepID=A0A9R1T2P1_9HYME|nr:PREDICTED: nucleoporin NUP53 [Fopius arisanus]